MWLSDVRLLEPGRALYGICTDGSIHGTGIENPALYGNRRFALDYTVLVKSSGNGGYGLYLVWLF